MISNTADIIDSRDVIERISELADDECLTEDETNELKALNKLEEAAKHSPDWECGEALINEDHFEQHMDEMVDDCYELPDLPSFMTIVIDYDQLKIDYTEVDFDGQVYLIRD